MKRILLLLLILPALLVAEVTPYDGIAAYVNDKIITADTVMRELQTNFDLTKIPPIQREMRVRELFPVMRDMIIDRMLILKAYDESGAALPNEYIVNQIEEIIAKQFEGSKAKLMDTLKRSNVTYDAWEKQIREGIIVAAMRQLQINKKLNVSPAKIRAWYAEHKNELAPNDGTRVRSILILPDQGRAQAEKAYAELKAGKPFAEVAKEYSSDEKAAEGGDWGFIKPEEVFSEKIAQTLAKLSCGQYSEIIESAGYCSIIYKDEERRGKVPSLEDAWPEVQHRLTAELGLKRYEAWLKYLRDKSYIKIEKSVLE